MKSRMPQTPDLGLLPATEKPASSVRQRFDSVTMGTFFGIVSALAYTGTNVALRKVARHGDLDWSIWVTAWKAVPAALTAWALIAWRGSRGLPALPPRRLVLPLLAMGLFMQVGNVMFQLALSLGGLALSVPLIFSTLILSGAWLGRVFLAEPITRRSAVAMGILMVSIALLSVGAEHATRATGRTASAPTGDDGSRLTTSSQAGSLGWTSTGRWRISRLTESGRPSLLTIAAGVLTACVAGLAYGTCGVVIRHAVSHRVSLSATLVLLSTTGVVVLGLISLWRMGLETLLATPPSDLAMMLVAGVFNAIAFFAVGASLSHIPVVRVNLLNASQIAMCGAAGVILFAEPITVWLIAGTALTVVGLLILEDRRQKPL